MRQDDTLDSLASIKKTSLSVYLQTIIVCSHTCVHLGIHILVLVLYILYETLSAASARVFAFADCPYVYIEIRMRSKIHKSSSGGIVVNDGKYLRSLEMLAFLFDFSGNGINPMVKEVAEVMNVGEGHFLRTCKNKNWERAIFPLTNIRGALLILLPVTSQWMVY